MIITIKVHAQARKNKVEECEDGHLKVSLVAPAVDGKANKSLIVLLADYYHVRKSQIEIIKGLKSKNKTVNIGIQEK
ncbi:DUF167 domain-containing protein [Candidatus Omnitrophota bacterium]